MRGAERAKRSGRFMNKFAFLFPGQGSQSTGMGKALADRYPAARQVFEEADEILSFPISRLCFEGPDDELKKTENTQAALLTVSVAAYRVLAENGFRPALVAGHSLGEYSALVAANCLEFKDALRLVRKRGRYMQEAVPEGVGAMAAVLKLPAERLDGVLAEAAQTEVVSAANLNSGSGRDRGPSRRRTTGNGVGESGRRSACTGAPRKCSISLLADAPGAGALAAGSRRHGV